MSATKAGNTSASYWFHLALRRACKAGWDSSKLIVSVLVIWFRGAFVVFAGEVAADYARCQATALPLCRARPALPSIVVGINLGLFLVMISDTVAPMMASAS